MKQLSFIISISLLFGSCSGSSPKTATQIVEQPTQSEVEVVEDTAVVVVENLPPKEALLPQDTAINGPCKELQEFVAEIEQANWVSDTERLKKVRFYWELDQKNVAYFNDRPFYPISFDNSRLKKAYYRGYYKNHFDSLDIELFGSVQNIWGFFYRAKEATHWISDGIIEQWEFETEEQAEEALRQILHPGFIVYFNTNPYFCRIENKLIIFQTRAMKFSLDDQGTLFRQFVEAKNASTLYS